MSVESLKTAFDVGAVLLLFLTFTFGAGAYITGNIVNRRQAAQLRQFDKDLTVAKTELAIQQARAATVERELTDAQTRLESERLRRLQLQRSVLHRMIPQTGVGEKRNWDSLKPFMGVNVVFRNLPGEPGMFAGNLAAFVMNAGWNFLGIHETKEQLAEGVTVTAYSDANGKTDMSTEAAKAFVKFLAANGVEGARFLSGGRNKLQPNTVEVLIGEMPDPFK